MKNRILIRALIVSIIAFALYAKNLKQVQNASVKVITPKSSQINQAQQKEPSINTAAPQQSYSKDVKVKSGSNKSLVSTIEKSMTNTNAYQVSVQDLNNPNKFAQLGTNDAAQSANEIMRLYVLITIYEKKQEHKLARKPNIKIKKADLIKGEKLLQPGMEYSIAYLRQAMMQGNKSAANALLRIAGKSEINAVVKKYGATDTVINSNFNGSSVGKTTAADLDMTMKGLYQAKVLNRQNAQLVLMAMHASKTPLVEKIAGTVYSEGDKQFSTAIVQNAGHSYVISVWANSNSKFADLGLAVNNWFNKNR